MVNAVLLAATYLLSSSDAVFPRYGFVPAHPHIFSLFSSLFLHVGLAHLIGNMFFLWMFGYRVENTLGKCLFGLVYLACGLGGHALHYLFNSNSPIPAVGASGAISGIVGCYFVLFPRAQFKIEVFFFWAHVDSIRARTPAAVGAWIAEQTLLALLTQTVRFSSTAFWAHVGGFATGVLATSTILLFAPHLRRRGEEPFLVRTVKGVVLDATGEPLPQARFEMQGEESNEIFTATTSIKGRFALDGVPEGCYSFTLTDSGRAPVQGRIVVRRKTRFNLPIKIRMPGAGRQNASIGDRTKAEFAQRL
jgi:membrane associated rhomboid family serine protease